MQNKQYDNAISDLAKAIVLKPDYAEAYNIRGVAYSGKSQKQLAAADFRKSCRMGLSDPVLKPQVVSIPLQACQNPGTPVGVWSQ